ncbi:MAG: hypothetical protein H0W06_09780 [Chloroflexia bacterium]|nr:hypothetical protein [Chloroflexia bacterium]
MTDRPVIQAATASNNATGATVGATGSGSSAAYRQEDDRRRDEARIATLQSQVDELRQLTRELASRQIRVEEVFKHQEGVAAQNRLAIEQQRKESQQSAQARAIDENRTRQAVEDLESRLYDQTRPIRSLQAHVTELLEASRKKVDDTGQNQQRFDEVITMIEHLSALGDRTSAVSHGMRDALDDMRGELEGLRRDIIRAEDAIKIVDQEGRRRVVDVKEIAESYSARIDELRADLGHIYDSLEDTRRGLVHLDPSLEELRAGELVLRQDVNRLQTQMTERHDLLIDMHDDARQENDARFGEIQQNLEQRAERLNERMEEAGELHRELAYKISDLNSQLEEARQVDAALHRDVWYLHEQRVRLRLEQIQEELDVATTQRRDAESDATAGSGGRFRRRAQRDDLDH